jgi:hypothetical protein
MAQFRVKDTLVTVLPRADTAATEEAAKLCIWRTRICVWPSGCRFGTCWCSFVSPCRWATCGQCSLIISVFDRGGCGFQRSCGAGGSACDPTEFCFGSEPFVINDKEDLVTLRKELQETLGRLDEVEKAGLTSGIASKAEADELERNLSEALEQVRAAKKNLK